MLTQFHNQLLAVDRPTPLERMGRGNISPTTIQALGPHVMANAEMFRQMKAIMAEVAALLWLLVLPAVTPMMPTMYCETTIKLPPKINMVRRPSFSTM